MVMADTNGELDNLEKRAIVGLIVRGCSMSGPDLVISLIPSSPRRSKCSGVSDMLTTHCRADPFVQHEHDGHNIIIINFYRVLSLMMKGGIISRAYHGYR